MFDQYDYINSILNDVPELKTLHRATGIAELEETLAEKVRGIQYPLIVTEDDGNGFLSLGDQPIDNAYYTLFILDKPDVNRSSSRKEKLKLCKEAAVKLFRRMKQDAVSFGDACFGLDFTRIEYDQIGPVGDGLHGYSISYLFKNENLVVE